MLCGRLNDAEAALAEASRAVADNSSWIERMDFVRECIRCDRFERKPGEIALQDLDTDLAKAKAGYIWPMKSLPEGNSGSLADISEALRQHRKTRDWRVLRGFLDGYPFMQESTRTQVNTFFQPEMAFCQEEASKGLMVPILAGAGFYRQLSQAEDLKNWPVTCLRASFSNFVQAR
jgi:hypothetical protein